MFEAGKIFVWAALGAALCAVCEADGNEAKTNLAPNPGFEDGCAQWGGFNDRSSWYEKPKGAGMSKASVTDETSRSGKNSCLIAGSGNRGLLMQHYRDLAPGEKYNFSGWIKTENMTGSKAIIDIIYYNKAADGGNQKWLGACEIGALDGDSGGWIKFEKTLPILEGTNMLVFQLRTSEPNSGKAWFDDISITKESSGAESAPADKK